MAARKATPVEIRVGQLWQDMDPRGNGGQYRIVRIEPYRQFTPGSGYAVLQWTRWPAHERKISLHRMRGVVADGLRSGWSLHTDTQEAA